jgi:hypothetical protein
MAVLAARAVARNISAAQRAAGLNESAMNRNFYFIGIAFFGMVNGLFNQVWLLFALLHVQVLAGPLFFGSTGLTLLFSSLMVSTATIILGGIPAAIYERIAGVKEDSNAVSLWIWLACTALLALPAMGNFFSVKL